MTQDNLLKLAERVEQAGDVDRALSWEIWEAVGKPGIDDASLNGSAPAYTSSLDHARTLVPEGHHWQVGIGIETEAGNRDGAYAWCSEADTGELSFAATPALALTAACIRAIAQTDTGLAERRMR